jgi:cupin superfamily acireductone dioxygenase involved in methionine salvage
MVCRVVVAFVIVMSAVFAGEVLTLPPELQRLGIQIEHWDVQDVPLDGVDLNNPSPEVIGQILNSADHEARVFNFSRPAGVVSLFEFSPETLGLDEILKLFDHSHTHTAPEMRLLLDGQGVYTIYDSESNSYQFEISKGSFIFIPEGVVHRFKPEGRRIKALRMFADQEGDKSYYVEDDFG